MQSYILVPPSGTEIEDEWTRLGIEAHCQGKQADAQRYYQNAIRNNPRHATATNNLAVVFAQSGFITEGILTAERATMLGDNGAFHANWGLMCLDIDQIGDALIHAEEGLRITPSIETRMALAQIYSTAGTPEKAVPLYDAVLAENPKHAMAGPNSCFVQTLVDSTPKEVMAQRAKWYEQNKAPQLPPVAKGKRKTLRVGYVSGDFKCHSAAMIFKNVICRHTDKVEVFLYSTLPVSDEDDRTKAFKAAGTWRDIKDMGDDQAAELIRSDRIDVLVDLSGHTNGGRLALFTRKPAPVQVTAWGFAHGTGVPEIDYFLADKVAVPESERKYYAEKIWDLPCIVTYDDPGYNLQASSSLPYYRNEHITFGVHARYEKISDKFLETVKRIMDAVPGSVVEFKDAGFRRPYSIRRIQSVLGKDRTTFNIGTTHPEHLQAYQRCDLILDPFPHTGGLVGMEQLYMGVPIVTRYGTQAAGRTTASVLIAMGRTGWIAKNEDEYVEIAARLASDIPALAAARKTLRDELMSSPVVNGYAQAVEDAYFGMWQIES